MAVTAAAKSSLGGLPRRLVDDGIIEEQVLLQAMDAAKRGRTTLVSYLIANNLAQARSVAVAASRGKMTPSLRSAAAAANPQRSITIA